ncbi:unnamed protein product [Cercospora beticola]|nr:unnamed protein product [Cercospora beticola]
MSPVLPALPRSDSKARLFNYIGLDMENNMHRKIYRLMKLEASEGRQNIISVLDGCRSATALVLRDRASTYRTSQVDTEAMAAECRRIYLRASSTTKPIYDLAEDPCTPGLPNWIIQWMLWHVFRYRDGRGELHRADRLRKTEDGDRAPPPPPPPTSGASWTSPLTTLWLTCQMWELANVVLSISIPCEESTGMD